MARELIKLVRTGSAEQIALKLRVFKTYVAIRGAKWWQARKLRA
jgi:hypothetical protein